MSAPFVLIAPASRGISLALARHYLRSTNLPVFATHRASSPDEVRQRILSGLDSVDPNRLVLLPVELTSEESIADAARTLKQALPGPASESHIHTAFFTGGILHPERKPSELKHENILQTFEVNVISHLLLIKHFSQFLPNNRASNTPLAKWVHVSARVGSVSDNRLGGWYSYRASKAALNQVIKTFDLHLQTRHTPAICVGAHPGTVKTNLSKEFWSSVAEDKLFEPESAATRLAEVVDGLTEDHRGRVWDWAGKGGDTLDGLCLLVAIAEK